MVKKNTMPGQQAADSMGCHTMHLKWYNELTSALPLPENNRVRHTPNKSFVANPVC